MAKKQGILKYEQGFFIKEQRNKISEQGSPSA
jgi:hypothetical protein